MENLVSNPITTEFVNNVPETYTCIGKGAEGTVYKLSPEYCIKIFNLERSAQKEAEAYRLSEGSPMFPKLYGYGSNYIVIELIEGIPLDLYIVKGGTIDEDLANKILQLFKEMKRLGFTRLDASTRHIFLKDDGSLRLVDHTHSFKFKDVRPLRLFSDLNALRSLQTFLEHVKKLDYDIYSEWEKSMDSYFVDLEN